MSEAMNQIPRIKLGNQGLEVSKLGFGCMTLSGVYNDPVPDEEAISLIKHAFNKGITLFDTANTYGATANEILVGKALKQLPREKIQLASKFGIRGITSTAIDVCGRPEYVRSCCEASLKRLGVDYIDLYYQHRIDQTIPIEDTMEELKKLVEEGKIKYIGLSEASPDTLRRAHAVHPITAVQMEWSLWTRDIEAEIIPVCRELGVGIVAYSPLGCGFFAGKAVVEELSSKSALTTYPRFSGGNLEKNKVLYERVAELAAKHGLTPAQLALAWVLHQGDDVVPIPGTTNIKHLDANIDSLKAKLSKEDLEEIGKAVGVDEVAGTNTQSWDTSSWRFANTPPKKGSKSAITSTQNQVAVFEKWDIANKIALRIIKKYISPNLLSGERGTAKEFLNPVTTRFMDNGKGAYPIWLCNWETVSTGTNIVTIISIRIHLDRWTSSSTYCLIEVAEHPTSEVVIQHSILSYF